MAGPRAAYFGTDEPDPMFMRTAAPGGRPNVLPEGLQSQPPMSRAPIPGPGESPPAELGGDGYEEAADLIAQMAQEYMGVDVNTLDDAGWTKLLQDLRAGYPDDGELLDAINFVEGQRASTSALEGVETGTEAMPLPPEGMSFNPDRPRY